MTASSLTPMKRAVRVASAGVVSIKGDVSLTEEPDLFPGFSASGQDVWLDRAPFAGPGFVLSAVGARCGKVFLASGRWGVVANTAVLLPRDGNHAKYLWYALNREGWWQKGGTAQPYVRVEESLTQGIFLPSYAEQERLAALLDRETQRIDLAVNKLLELLDLLSEREFSAITAAIDSVTERRIRLSLVAKLGTGHTPDRAKPEYWEDCSIPWVTAADLSGRTDPYEPLTETSQHISELGVANSAAVVHPAGTVMLCRTASVGLVCRIGAPMATTQAFVTWTPQPSLDSEYLMFCLVAMRDEWNRLKFGSTHDTIYFPDIQSIKIPFASLAAQHQAVGDIQVALEKTRELRQRATDLIELLLERRQALISAAVTGQLDVEAMV